MKRRDLEGGISKKFCHKCGKLVFFLEIERQEKKQTKQKQIKLPILLTINIYNY